MKYGKRFMKLDITNKELKEALSNIAQDKFLTPELLVKQILEEYVSANYKQSSSKIHFTVSEVKSKSEWLSNVINVMLERFKYGCDLTEVKLVEGMDKRYKIEVRL